MDSKRVIGILDFYNDPGLDEITYNRPLGSTSFLGRYAFCDFALSNFCNSGIEEVGLLIKEHSRSIFKHLGNMNEWVTNTKIGHRAFMLNETGVLNPRTNTDLANLRENDWSFYDTEAQYLIFQSSHVIANVDLRPILREHIARGEKITVVGAPIADASREFLGANLFRMGEDGYLESVRKNRGEPGPALASMEIWILNREVIDKAIASANWDEGLGVKDVLLQFLHNGTYKIHVSRFDGAYCRYFDSFDHYVEYSLELLDPRLAAGLFDPKWPHYTKSHDTPPALYGENASICNSFVANGAIIEGDVFDSIICRNVHIGKGSSVHHCIVFTNTHIGENCHLENALIDKYCTIRDGGSFTGDPRRFVFLKQGSIL